MKTERRVPYAVIAAAKRGDPDAMDEILRHYDAYISVCSRRIFCDESGNPYTVVDEDIRHRIQEKLMLQVFYDFDPYQLPAGEKLEE